MKSTSSLNGFPQKTATYLSKLSKNNNREWFEKNRELYNSDFLEPAIQFVLEMGDRLLGLDPELLAIPKVDKSIFRLHRDVRFSKDKSPYKTNMGLYFWNGKAKKSEAVGFYFHVEPKSYGAASGLYMPPPYLLKRFRDAVANPEKGKELHLIINTLQKKKYDIGGKKFKRIPKGYSEDSPYSEYLLYEGIYSWYESSNFKDLTGGKAIEKVFKIFKEMLVLHKWLIKNLY
jgi:uncharacterized protein (TIGR02453 family)